MKNRPHIWLAALLFLITLSVFWPLTRSNFINYDDNVVITENLQLKSGLTLGSIAWSFTTTYASNWVPLTWLSHLIDVELFGFSPGGHHFTNMLLHAASAVVLFLVLRLMTGSLWRSFVVAMLFSLHPLHVESVAWVTLRRDVLSTFMWFLCMGLYYYYVLAPGWKRYLPVMLTMALGLMAKPMLVTLPLVLMLLDIWPLRRWDGTLRSTQHLKRAIPQMGLRHLLLEKTPMLGLSAASTLITLLAQKTGGAIKSVESYPLDARLGNALVSYMTYLFKMVWPQNLIVFYPHPGKDLLPWKIWTAAAILLLISAFVWLFRRHGYLLTGWVWYVVTLIPVIGLVQAGDQGMADRYTYVPLVGIFIALAWGISETAAKLKSKNFILPFFTVTVLIASTALTRAQVGYWFDSKTLFEHALRVDPNNYVAHNNYGIVLDEMGKHDEAIPHYRQSVAQQPTHIEALANLGVSYVETGDYEEAKHFLSRALMLNGDHAEALNYTGLLLSAQGQHGESLAYFRKAISIKPQYVEAYFLLGHNLAQQGSYQEAENYFRKVIMMDPAFSQAFNNLGLLLSIRGADKEGKTYLLKALDLNPKYAKAHFNLGNIFKKEGSGVEALNHYKKAMQINPDYIEARREYERLLKDNRDPSR
jgi:tetratricopeptide (TPR) repeat protein